MWSTTKPPGRAPVVKSTTQTKTFDESVVPLTVMWGLLSRSRALKRSYAMMGIVPTQYPTDYLLTTAIAIRY
jgi:hypothetical protein